MKYVIDSSGMLVAVPDKQSVFRFIPLETRAKELNAFSLEFASMAKQFGYNTDRKGYCFLIQPFHTNEKLVFFTRTEFSSSSQTVKLANELKQHPERITDRYQMDFLRSIFPLDENGRTRWFLLTVSNVEFERNLYDCKKINIKYSPTIPYEFFMNNLEESLITEREMDARKPCSGYKLFTNGVDLSNGSRLLAQAYDRDIEDGIHSKFDNNISRAIHKYKAVKYASKDDKSNEAIHCLAIINSEESVYPVYVELKNFIKKNFQNATVRYSKNEIKVQLHGQKEFSLFAGGANDPRFVLNGNLIEGMEEIKQTLLKDLPSEPQWYTERLKHNIPTKTVHKKISRKKKDVLGWTKTNKKEVKRNGRQEH